MLLVKISNAKSDRTDIFNKTIKNLSNYIIDKLSFPKTKLTSDSNCIEITSGNANIFDDEQIIAEVTIKKVISINKDSLSDKEKLDKFLYELKEICNYADDIEKINYTPVHLRSKRE